MKNNHQNRCKNKN